MEEKTETLNEFPLMTFHDNQTENEPIDINFSDDEIQKSSDNRKILIVDDNLANIESLKIIIKYTLKLDPETLCDTAINGSDAIDIIEKDMLEVHNGSKSSYALIFCDIQMPQMDGFEFS